MNQKMTFGQWLGTLLLLLIPCVNIILLLVWAFGNGPYKARQNFARAYLIFVAITYAISLIGSFFMSALGVASGLANNSILMF